MKELKSDESKTANSLDQTERIRQLENELAKYRETAKELAISEERYALAVRGTHDGIWDWEISSGKVIYSPRFKALLGYREEEMAEDLSEFTSRLHADDVQPTMDAIQAHLEEAIPYDVEYRLKHRNGDYLWFHARGEAVRDKHGEAVRMAGAISDITQRKEVEEELKLTSNRLILATRAGGIGVFDYDIKNNILVWDEEMYRIYGVDPEQFSGAYEAWEEGVHPDDLEEQRERLQRAIAEGESFDSDFRVIWPSDGSVHHINANATVLFDESGEVVRMIGANWDITESRRIQEELRIAREKAEAAAEAKSEFVANMSHEIRTPMNGIMGMAALLRGTNLNETQLEYLNHIGESSEALLAIIDDVLDFSKIEAGMFTIDPHEFRLRESLGDLLQELAIQAAEKQLEITFEVDSGVPDRLIGDLGRIRQILVNLLGNGIKFTPEGEVVLNVKVDSRVGDKAVLNFTVRDTGIGIPKEKHESIFDSFNQAENSTTRLYGGTGLGLSISQRLVEMMNGRIWMDSEPGRGSTFQFTIEVEAGDPDEEDPPGNERFAGRRILLVDDHPTSRVAMGNLFTNLKLKPEAAKSGEEAIEKLIELKEADHPVDLVFIDLEMPGMDGIETSAAIQKEFGNEGPGLFIMSAIPHSIPKEQGMELGIEAFLRKPLKPSALRSALDRYYGTVDSPTREPVAEDSQRISRASSMRVLLAEDGRVNQIVAVNLLEERGARVTLAKDGKAAVEQFLEDTFDAILMDIHMPKLDGYGATAAIREAESENGTGRVPIIAMTANAMAGDRGKCLDAGMDDYLSKPVRPAELFSILERFHSPETSGNGEPELDVFDPREFRATFPSLDFARELINYFPEEAGGYLEDARKAMAQKDSEALHHAAHSLKGTVGNYSAKGAYEAAKTLDNFARDGDFEAAAKTLVDCEKEVSKLGKALEEFMEESGAN